MPAARAFGLVVLAGAALRFATLDVQSLWYDEAVSAHLLQMDLGAMLRAIPDSESAPPLYYVLAWLWAQVAGTGEVGLRALPALFGTATIPVAWALGRRLGGERAGLFAAALVAVNPLLVWFSQEARAYSLLALLGALSALLWLRALESPRRGRLLAWGVVAALALATHYYAIFLVAPEALWLLLRAPDTRARLAALAAPVAAAAALLPLALRQRSNDSAAFIGESGLAHRLVQVPKQFLVGYDAPRERLLAVVSTVALLVAGAGLAWLLTASGRGRFAARARGDAARLTAIAAAALVVPVLLALAGEDHIITRNLLAALPIVLALAGAGLGAVAAVARRPAAAAAALACALGLVAVLGVAGDPAYQRDDWRGAAHAIGDAGGDRVIVAAPGALIPLRYYLPGVRPLSVPFTPSVEVDYIALAPRRGGGRTAPPRPAAIPQPAPGLTVAGRSEARTYTVLRLRPPAPQLLAPEALVTGLDGAAAQPLQQPEPQR
ncbi:MAG: mannosyltransferase [Solirubrobacteraceae bacterium]|jgi:4-amino-4-deoxy-L-arabinose transferase-like glycosyltransferase|nr:mannosyltransferase [Solirubrobacteraceae bacterium]